METVPRTEVGTGTGWSGRTAQDSTLVIVLEVDTPPAWREDEVMRSGRFQALQNRFPPRGLGGGE